jgi:hypothetical protein
LREYIVKGFTIDDEKLKNVGGGVYWKVSRHSKKTQGIRDYPKK